MPTRIQIGKGRVLDIYCTNEIDKKMKTISLTKGDKGDRGIQGLPGNDGYTPVKGVDYFDGAQGIQGLKGDKGDKGNTGLQGIQGLTGLQGLKGDTGVQGERGLQGIQGVPGTDATVTNANVLSAIGYTPADLSVGALPVASINYRGKMRYVEGGAGVADKYYICAKLANNTYKWIDILSFKFGY
jgi:hypothetical protein